ncbi:RNA ligase family protein [Myxococcota bacterium]|nr:RNA ligase family protein [Myxococcota bacterium]MBU1431405.1 RNA ligase family protein [Myxococcota bacterium]MBU1898523.1 RNA ligase family protein [Myxococcota bacterium]
MRRHASYQGKDEDGNPIYGQISEYPKLSFTGTVKLHGSNASVAFHPDGQVFIQSRNRILTVEEDNHGFARFIHEGVGLEKLRAFAEQTFGPPDESPLILYGEWCGGSIQRGVALAQLDRMWVIFAARRGAEEETSWLDVDGLEETGLEAHQIFSVNRFGRYAVTIDFERPELARNEMVALTLGVEARCPAGASFGVEGTGEGIVWRCVDPRFISSNFWFKTKGEAHSATKVRTLSPVDPEIIASREAFIDAALSPRRLEQGIEHLQELRLPLDKRSTGDFLRWVFNDVLSEESDTLAASGLDQKSLGAPLSRRARLWFMQRIGEAGEDQ